MFAKASVRDWLTLGVLAVGAGLAGHKLLAWQVTALAGYAQTTSGFQSMFSLALSCRDSGRRRQRESVRYAM